jgi:hypothetical protein
MSKFVLSNKALANPKSSGMRKFLSNNKDLKKIYSNPSKREALFKELQPLGSGGGVTQGEFKKVLAKIRTGQVKGLDSRYGKIMTNVARETNFSFIPKAKVPEKSQLSSAASINSRKPTNIPQQPTSSFRLKEQSHPYINPERGASRTIADKASIKSNMTTSNRISAATEENKISENSDISKLPD